MPSKEQKHDNNKANSKQRPSKPFIDNLEVLARQQPHLAPIIQRARSDSSSLASGEVQQLQRRVGNKAVVRLLTKTGPDPVVQPKLRRGPAGLLNQAIPPKALTTGQVQRVPVTADWKEGMDETGKRVLNETVGEATDTADISDEKLKKLREYLSVTTHRVNETLKQVYSAIEKEYAARMKQRANTMIKEALDKEGIDKWEGNLDKIIDWFGKVKSAEELDTFDQAFIDDRMTLRQINIARDKADQIPMDYLKHVDKNIKETKSGTYGRGVPSMQERMKPENFLDDPGKPRQKNAKGLHESGGTLLDHTRSINDQAKPYGEAVQVFMPVPSEHHLRVFKGLETMSDRDEKSLQIMRAYMTRITKAQASDMATGHVYVSDPSKTGEDVEIEYGLRGKMEPTEWDPKRPLGLKREATESDIEERRTRALEYKEILKTHKELSGKEVAIEHRQHEGQIFPIYTKWIEGKGFEIIDNKDKSLVGKMIRDQWEEGQSMII